MCYELRVIELMTASMSRNVLLRGFLACLVACLLLLVTFSMGGRQTRFNHQYSGVIQTRSSSLTRDILYQNKAIYQVNQTRRQVRVLVAILTCPKNLYKVRAVNNTWAKHCDKVIFLSTEAHKDFPIVALNVTEDYEHLTAKTMTGFQYIYDNYFNDFDWFMKVDDDTYVIMENLRHFLSAQNTSEPVFCGHHFAKYVKQGYHSGGAGYVLSKEALRRFGQRGNSPDCVADQGAEDVSMGKCLESLAVRVLPSRDSRGRSRFHALSPSDVISGRNPNWMCIYDNASCLYKGPDSISDYPITFHYVSPTNMVQLEYYVYRLKAFKEDRTTEGSD